MGVRKPTGSMRESYNLALTGVSKPRGIFTHVSEGY